MVGRWGTIREWISNGSHFKTIIIVGILTILLIYQAFGVVRVKDRLVIKFSQKSSKLRRLFKKSKLNKMVFKTSWAGQFNKA